MVLAFPLLQLPGPFFDLGFLFGRQTVSLAHGASSGLSVRIGDAATRPQSKAKRVLVFDWPACQRRIDGHYAILAQSLDSRS
jgi:hypothetical protein